MAIEVANIPEITDSALLAEQRSRRIALLCRTLCVVLALAETWSQRHFLNEDGVSYLDMSDWLLRHNWHLLVNPIWSPLYPMLIGIATWLTRPSAAWEIPLVHGVNFLIFLAALASFEFMLRSAVRVLGNIDERKASGRDTQGSLWLWQFVGYGLFAWSTFGMIWGPKMVTPDLLVAAFVYLDCGLVLRLRTASPRLQTAILLGMTLGFGYLAKAILFPMAFVFVVLALAAIGSWRRALLPLTATMVLFAAIAAPMVAAMSLRVGKLSYSEVGNLNYAWHVNDVTAGKAAGGPFFPAESGPPSYFKHPLILLNRHPEIYEFREPRVLTYPPRSDMQYWGAGTPVVFNLHNQFVAFAGGLKLLVRDSHILPLTALILLGMALVLIRPGGVRTVAPSWPLLIPGVLGPFLYLLISVEPRYLAPFFVAILVGLFPAVLGRGSEPVNRRVAAWSSAIASLLLISAGLLVAYHAAGYPRQENGDEFLEIGTSLNQAGIEPGVDIGIIGDSSDGSRWGRLARVHIVAQLLREDAPAFWPMKDREAQTIYAAFTRAGASAIVAEEAPVEMDPSQWKKLGNTNYYVHRLPPNGGSHAPVAGE
ncbi:MAG: hypothetical protein WA294_18830 [Acidobacteriaceae bacterium]